MELAEPEAIALPTRDLETEELNQAIAVSPNKAQIASGDKDGTIRLNSSTGKLLKQFEGHLGAVRGVAFSPNAQQLASAGEDGTVRLWNIQEDQQQAVFQVHDMSVNSAAFSPDGEFLVSGDEAGNVQLWNLKTGQQLSAWLAHPGRAIREVRIGAKGQKVITTADDGTAYEWPLDDLAVLRTRGCDLLRDYLSQRDGEASPVENRNLCQDIRARK